MNINPTAEPAARKPSVSDPVPEWLKVVRAQVESVKFGTVLITIHDAKVVQIERNEKTRLDRQQ